MTRKKGKAAADAGKGRTKRLKVRKDTLNDLRAAERDVRGGVSSQGGRSAPTGAPLSVAASFSRG